MKSNAHNLKCQYLRGRNEASYTQYTEDNICFLQMSAKQFIYDYGTL